MLVYINFFPIHLYKNMVRIAREYRAHLSVPVLTFDIICKEHYPGAFFEQNDLVDVITGYSPFFCTLIGDRQSWQTV